MTFARLAEMVADDFRQTMKEEGFDTFKDMCRSYWWNAQDVREEIISIIDLLSKKCWEENREDFSIADDGSFLQIGFCEEMGYGTFKKMVMDLLK